METLKKFGLSTSVKGIPRAIKSKSRPLRILWSVCVILCLVCAIYQSYFLTQSYLAFDVTTTLSEYWLDLVGLTEHNVDLPDISICNANPFGSNTSMVQAIPTLEDFYGNVLNLTSCDNCSQSQKQKLEIMRKILLSPGVYAENIGPDNVRKIGHSLESMLVDCQLLVIEGRILQQRPCFPGTNTSYRQDVNFYNCYTLRLPTPSLPDKIYFGVSLVLHLDNFFQDHLMYFDNTNARTRMAGIEFNFYSPNTMIFADIDSIFVPPGFLGNLKLKYERRIRMPHPYGNCINHADPSVTNAHKYSADHCYASCVQAHVADTCSCVDINPYTDGNKIFKNLTKCFDIDRSPEDLLQTWECVVRERYHAILPCAGCKQLCDDLKYDTQVDCLFISSYTQTHTQTHTTTHTRTHRSEKLDTVQFVCHHLSIRHLPGAPLITWIDFNPSMNK